LERGFRSASIHGDLGQSAREKALNDFKAGKSDVLVATDVAARGIDIDGITHVINYQCPEDEKTYVHRIGRTARAGAEGISLKCCRTVHIMEPYWNNVRLDQVKGRAIRICSHKDLPFKDREVEIYTYYTVFSEEQKRSDKIDQTIRGTDNNETSDEKVYYVSIKKDKINQEILKLMKESAVDCELNAGENDGIQCFRIEGQATQYLFDPNLEVDKIVTSIELKEVRGDLQSRVSRALDVSAPAAPVVDRIKVLRIRGIEYLLKPAEGTTTEFLLYGRNDTTFVGRVFGTISSDPTLGKYTSLHLYETQ
jgi:superfamily II DNA/RNA helicase